MILYHISKQIAIGNCKITLYKITKPARVKLCILLQIAHGQTIQNRASEVVQTIQTHTFGIVWPGCIEPAATHTTKSRPSLTGSHRPQYQRDGETDRERKERQRKQSRPSPRSGRGTEKDEARRNEEQPRTRDRCRRPCMICDTDRESWREEARERQRELERREKRGSKDNLHYFSRFFMPTPEPRPAEPATRAAVIVSVSTHGKAFASIPLLWSMGNWRQSTPIFSPCRPGDGLHFRSRRKPGSQLLYPLLHLPKNFSISLLLSVP